jgi:ribonuclease III
MDIDKYVLFAQTKLGITFKNIDLLITALTHRSYLNEHKKTATEHNERMEFLGDAVLELVVTEYLYSNHSEPEGILTNWRSSLVRTESISAAASRLEFMELIRMSRGEKRGSDRAKMVILANAFEAVTGAIYLDQGYDVSAKFITDNILSTFQDILDTGAWLDPKSTLQEKAQSLLSHTPVYKVLSEVGPDHDKVFTVGVYLGDEMYGQGNGTSKQLGQQAAATDALGKLVQNKA